MTFCYLTLVTVLFYSTTGGLKIAKAKTERLQEHQWPYLLVVL